MGRTQTTYRMRLQQLRETLLKLAPSNRGYYHDMWQSSHKLSAPSSTFPYPDTHAVATFAMILDVITRLDKIKNRIEKDYGITVSSD